MLALALAVVVWFSAETAANPNIESTRSVPLEIDGLDPNMLVVGTPPAQVRVTLRTPSSVMNSLDSVDGSISAWVDVSGLEAGTYELEVKAKASEIYGPVRISQITPQFVTLTLEPLITRSIPVDLETMASQPSVIRRYTQPHPNLRDRFRGGFASRSGGQRLVTLDISEADETVMSISPSWRWTQTASQSREVLINRDQRDSANLPARRVSECDRQGAHHQPAANGYKLTNITVSPLNVVVFASDPQLVNDLRIRGDRAGGSDWY
jgi:hypothetical protein